MIQIDMDIPKTCDDCPFHIYHSGKKYVCVATPLFYPMNLANYKDGRKDFCPLKEIAQEPRKGHWIANAPQYDMLNPQYICSECGNAHTRTTPYCEMCGAKMFEPQESEDNNGKTI